MIDNFDKIIPLLQFPSEDNFYFVQILQRKKDHPGTRLGGSNNNSRLIKAYYINSVEKLLILKEEMIKLADLFKARIGINLNPRSFEKTAFQLLQKVSNQMMNKDFYGVRKAYDSVCGNYHSEIDKRWLLDIDTKDDGILLAIEIELERLFSKIENRDYKILAKLETKSGYHFITNPFNVAEFSKGYPEVEIHKNNPTLLYMYGE
jgi:hypothetical protein